MEGDLHEAASAGLYKIHDDAQDLGGAFRERHINVKELCPDWTLMSGRRNPKNSIKSAPSSHPRTKENCLTAFQIVQARLDTVTYNERVEAPPSSFSRSLSFSPNPLYKPDNLKKGLEKLPDQTHPNLRWMWPVS